MIFTRSRLEKGVQTLNNKRNWSDYLNFHNMTSDERLCDSISIYISYFLCNVFIVSN